MAHGGKKLLAWRATPGHTRCPADWLVAVQTTPYYAKSAGRQDLAYADWLQLQAQRLDQQQLQAKLKRSANRVHQHTRKRQRQDARNAVKTHGETEATVTALAQALSDAQAGGRRRM